LIEKCKDVFALLSEKTSGFLIKGNTILLHDPPFIIDGDKSVFLYFLKLLRYCLFVQFTRVFLLFFFCFKIFFVFFYCFYMLISKNKKNYLIHFKMKNTLKTTFTIMLNTALITRKEKK
jgi:hypothetical protein